MINAEAPFKERVVDAVDRQRTRTGSTPNPCLSCNRHIRFGYLLNYARSLGASLSGDRALRPRPVAGATAGYQLWRGADRAKDQSYVLSVLGQADLRQALFPVGEYTKPQVRALAAERGLPTASRVDSQDLCFVTDGDYRRFLGEHAPEAVRPGPILDSAGRQFGAHRGLPFYTIGQRSGLGIAAREPLYVLELDIARNAVIVGTRDRARPVRISRGPVNWVAGEPPALSFAAEVQIRYRSQPGAATVTATEDGGAAVALDAPLRDVTPGQAAVFYAGEQCLGGGLILQD